MQAPGPKKLPFLGNTLELRKDVIELLMDSQKTYGDFVEFKMGPIQLYTVFHPDDIRQVLKSKDFDKDTRTSEMISLITGKCILTASGEDWSHRRRMMQNWFSKSHMLQFEKDILNVLEEELEKLDLSHEINLCSFFTRLTFLIIQKILFKMDDKISIEEEVNASLSHVYNRISNPLLLPEAFPTPKNLRFKNARKKLYEKVDETYNASMIMIPIRRKRNTLYSIF